MDRIRELVAAAMAVGALVVVAKLALVDKLEVAVGAVISVVSAAVAWYLRGRVQAPRE